MLLSYILFRNPWLSWRIGMISDGTKWLDWKCYVEGITSEDIRWIEDSFSRRDNSHLMIKELVLIIKLVNQKRFSAYIPGTYHCQMLLAILQLKDWKMQIWSIRPSCLLRRSTHLIKPSVEFWTATMPRRDQDESSRLIRIIRLYD